MKEIKKEGERLFVKRAGLLAVILLSGCSLTLHTESAELTPGHSWAMSEFYEKMYSTKEIQQNLPVPLRIPPVPEGFYPFQEWSANKVNNSFWKVEGYSFSKTNNSQYRITATNASISFPIDEKGQDVVIAGKLQAELHKTTKEATLVWTDGTVTYMLHAFFSRSLTLDDQQELLHMANGMYAKNKRETL